jgi:hypothetical protein
MSISHQTLGRSLLNGLTKPSAALILDHVPKKLSSLFTARHLKYQIYDMWKPFPKFHICISYLVSDRLKALASKPVKPRDWIEFKSIGFNKCLLNTYEATGSVSAQSIRMTPIYPSYVELLLSGYSCST